MKFIISGSSGAGKNTIINKLLREDDSLALLTTVTTRAMRPGESQWDPYYFTTEADFRAMIERGEFLKYCEVHKGILYGTNRRILEEKEKLGKTLIKDIDVEGTEALKKLFGDDVVTVYLSVSRDVLEKRLVERGETEIEKRLARYEFEESKKHLYDYVVQNDHDTPDPAAAEIRAIIANELGKNR